MVRKKKSTEKTIKEVSKLVAEVTLQDTDPVITKVVKGSHLTVTHYSNGKTKLVWDDAALMRDVLEALSTVEKPKKAKKPKKVVDKTA